MLDVNIHIWKYLTIGTCWWCDGTAPCEPFLLPPTNLPCMAVHGNVGSHWAWFQVPRATCYRPPWITPAAAVMCDYDRSITCNGHDSHQATGQLGTVPATTTASKARALNPTPNLPHTTGSTSDIERNQKRWTAWNSRTHKLHTHYSTGRSFLWPRLRSVKIFYNFWFARTKTNNNNAQNDNTDMQYTWTLE